MFGEVRLLSDFPFTQRPDYPSSQSLDDCLYDVCQELLPIVAKLAWEVASAVFLFKKFNFDFVASGVFQAHF